MPRTSLFEFFARFRAGGIGDAKKQPRYSDDIQLVSVVQDIAATGAGFDRFESLAPTIMPSYGAHMLGPGPQRSVGQLRAGEFGLWLTGIFLGTAGSFFAIDIWTEGALVALDDVQTDLDPVTALNCSAWGDGRNALAVIRFGNQIVPFVPPAQSWSNFGSNAGQRTGVMVLPEPTYIGPGRVVFIQHTGNGSQNLGYYWREPLSLPV